MKRKLDENNEPVLAETPSTGETAGAATTFRDLGLEDPRLLQAVASQGFEKPTLVQSKAIPLVLDGHDVLAKAKTGSGKTAAYVLPLLQAILRRKKTSSESYIAALIVVPTRELADQVAKSIDSFSAFAAKEIQTVKLSDKVSDAVQKALLSNTPDIVVATPSRAWKCIESGALSVEKLTHLVLDEADLLLQYGYNEDLQSITGSIPKNIQTTLMSATLTTEVDTLKGTFCRSPTVLDLEEPDAEGEGVRQFVVKCAEDEKFLLTYVCFKMGLIKGKSIIFVSDVDRSYRLKLFLDQFGIRSTILNAELPLNSRLHTIEEFNRNVYDIIIASDENEAIGDEDSLEATTVQDGAGEEKCDSKKAKGKNTDEVPPKKKRKSSRRDKEYGAARGIDFSEVACVINFDLPTSSKSYTHRVGRTARAGRSGLALSFVIPKEKFRKHLPTSIATAENDEKVLDKIVKQQSKKGKEIKPYLFDMKQVEAFRYRMNDALRAVTKVAIREARTRELRQELLKSEKLKRHFEENPAELSHLVRHDGELRAARTQPHLRHVPDYLLPAEGRKGLTSQNVGFVPFRKPGDGKGKRGKSFKGRGKKFGGRKADPLKSFKGRPKGK
ncbi:ATP-dependent RNA helicase dbp9 [Pseudomassariella vexata]|uniref:RNA helicase n=1 Tax=Pseudomassariella vexata TaxID=1141098 RepID=A0A1Y2EDY7_9PEZI|nr:ATP-dependent RNA helicase dbp9 [Pseudomassariella vexata]ORY69793.1 ATP-dependent RNA helicase dbp9 [Pseudomassariella vexata]